MRTTITVVMMEQGFMSKLKDKYKYCTSVAFYKSKLFRSHKFKVEEDKEFILKAFTSKDTETLDFYEMFYKDMLKNDRVCERDLASKINFEDEIPYHATTEETLTIGELVDAWREGFSSVVSKGKKIKAEEKAKKQT